MKYMDIGCDVRCWECTRDCNKKDLLFLSVILPDSPELAVSAIYKGKEIILHSENILNFFYFAIIDSLKPMAGKLLAQGKEFEIVQQDLMELAVSFYVARLKTIESISED